MAGKLCHLIGSWLGLFLRSTSILREGRSCSTRLSSLWSLPSLPPWPSLSITSFSKKDVVGRLVIQDFWQTRERDFFFLPTGVYRFGRLYLPTQKSFGIQNYIWNFWRTYFQWFALSQTIKSWRKFQYSDKSCSSFWSRTSRIRTIKWYFSGSLLHSWLFATSIGSLLFWLIKWLID